MNVIVDFTVVPVGTGLSLSPYVAEVERVLRASGLPHELHANGTNVEGEWDAVMATIRACHEAVHAMGVVRIHTDIKLGTRTDRDQHMADKIASVRAKM
ncbi:MAG: MTH1187 family thiamine-binding protein [Holophaga sp.]|nr:MTH1187 family thiamine-binding protein [Holophaga sp.]